MTFEGGFKLIIGACLLVALPAYASNEPAPASSIDTVAVTASRMPVSASEQSRSVEIISRAEITGRNVPSVTELLRQVAGLNIIQQGSRGNVTSVLMRGGEPNFTVVLIDGLQINDPTNTRGGSYDFSFLDPSAIERIEIVRGPMSAQYGSDSLAGVINIITRKGAEGSSVSAAVGGDGFQSANVAWGVEIGRFAGAVRVHALNDDGDLPGSSYDDTGLDASVQMRVSAATEWGVSARVLTADSTGFPEDSGGPALAVLRQPDKRDVTEGHVQGYLNHQIRPNLSASVAVGRFDREEDFASAGIAPGVFDGVPPNSADTRFVRDRAELSMNYAVSSRSSVIVGSEWQREEGRSVGLLDFGFPLPTDFSLERDTVSAFAEGLLQLDRAVLQASLRWDKPDDIGSETSAHAGAVFDLGDGGTQLRATWGQGFKAPSFFALAHPLVGNPALLSETAESWEVGLRFAIGLDSQDPLATFETTVFHSTYNNLIDFDPVLFTNVNRREVVNSGVELAGAVSVTDSLRIRGHITYLDSDIKDSDANLRGRPNWRLGAVVDWRINSQWQLVTSLLASDDFYESSIATGSLSLPGYERLDLALNYVPADRWRLGLAIDNVLNTRYEEAVGFTAAGLRGRVSAHYRF